MINNKIDFIFNLIKDFYDNIILNNSKEKNNEWTIHSAIILKNNDDYKIICFTNGTKSLPNINYYNKKFQIFDCHAEILCLKCFQFFIIKCLIFNIDKKNEKKILKEEEFKEFKKNENFYSIFEIDKNNLKNKVSLKKNIEFFLYISSSPCGDASKIINNDKKIGSKTIEQIIEFYNNYLKNNNIKFIEKNSNLYEFRTKSIRSDFKPEILSFSLSCTDKLLIKNILGYEGKYLNLIINSIYINNIIISEKENNIIQISNSLNYLIRNNKSLIKNNYKPKIIIIDKFLTNNININKIDKNSQPFSFFWYFPSSLQKIDPSLGLKSGSRKDRMDIIENFRVTLCNYNLCELIFKFIINFGNNILCKKISKILLINENLDYVDILNILIKTTKRYKIKEIFIKENEKIKEFLELKYKLINKNIYNLKKETK